MLADQYDAFLVDMDGVVHLGEEAVPGAPEAIRALRDRGKTVRFVTNNSRASREALVEKLAGFGIEAEPADVVSAGWATVAHVADRGVDAVHVLGGDQLAEMVRAEGIAVRDEDVDAVVVGHDESVTYDDLQRATRLVVHGGADLVAANADGWFPTEGGVAPGTGAILAALEAATETEATVVGKPEPEVFEIALDGLPADRTVMVGDNPTSDVVGAERAGIDAVLVTGGRVEREAAGADPVATVEDLAGLFGEAGPPGADGG